MLRRLRSNVQDSSNLTSTTERVPVSAAMPYIITKDQLREIVSKHRKSPLLASHVAANFLVSTRGANIIRDVKRGFKFNNIQIDIDKAVACDGQTVDEYQLAFLRMELAKMYTPAEVDMIINAHSQMTCNFVKEELNIFCADHTNMMINRLDFVGNVYKATSSNDSAAIDNTHATDIYVECITNGLTLYDLIESKHAGYITENSRVIYKCVLNETGQYQYEFVSFETNNEDLYNIIAHRYLDASIQAASLQKYCNADAVNLIQYREKLNLLEQEIGDLADNNPIKVTAQKVLALEEIIYGLDDTSPIKIPAQKVLAAIVSAVKEGEAPVAKINIILDETEKLIKNPTPDNAVAYNKLANKVATHSWGRILGGAMLILAGVTIAAVCTAIAVASFGTLAPISLFGYVLAGGLMTAGTACTVAGVAAVGTIVGVGLFTSGIKAQPNREAINVRNSMKHLSHAIKVAKPESIVVSSESNRTHADSNYNSVNEVREYSHVMGQPPSDAIEAVASPDQHSPVHVLGVNPDTDSNMSIASAAAPARSMTPGEPEDTSMAAAAAPPSAPPYNAYDPSLFSYHDLTNLSPTSSANESRHNSAALSSPVLARLARKAARDAAREMKLKNHTSSNTLETTPPSSPILKK